MKKKGFEANPLSLLIVAIIIIATAYIVYKVFISPISPLGESTLKLSPGQDSLCVISTSQKEKISKTQIIDMDKDGRDDSCDWCICPEGKGCNNNYAKSVTGGNDNDGDFLPYRCDKDDTPGKGRATVGFNTTACKKGENLYEIGGGSQCYFSS